MTSDEPWLSTDERSAWLGFVGMLMKFPAALDSQLEHDQHLNFFEYMVLALLSEESDRTLQMSDLAGLTSASLSRLSHAVTRLEKQGFLRRERLPGTGRRTAVILTDNGLAKVVEAAPGHVRRVRELLIDAVTADELAALASAGSKVLARIDPDDTCPSA